MALVLRSSNYCGYCGNKLPQVAKTELRGCAVCGSKIPASVKFCPHCGEATRNPERSEMRMRFSWLKDMEKTYASDYSRFRAAGLPGAEDEKEQPVFEKAKKRAKDANEPVMIHVVLFEKRGEIDSFPWALIRPDSTIEYVCPTQE